MSSIRWMAPIFVLSLVHGVRSRAHLNLNVGDLHRWMQVIGHDGRCTHSIRSGGGSQVWHSDSASMNERLSRR